MINLNHIIEFTQIGFTHVIPWGYDHILFILSIFFLNSNVKSVIIQCTVFTVAHSVALGLTAAGIMITNSSMVEPLISISIVFTAIGNIIQSKISPYRLVMIFLFGIIHGMGFASAFMETAAPAAEFYTTLLSFNMGVELGQLTIVLLAYILVSKWFNNKAWYRERIVYPVSTVIAGIALSWTIIRIIQYAYPV